jgi:hypothetical protein
MEVWDQSGRIFTVLFPFFAVIPVCLFMLYDKKHRDRSSQSPTVLKKQDLITRWIVSSIGGAFIVFFVSFTGLIISLYFIPEVVPVGSDYAMGYYAGNYFINQPLLYGLVLSCWRAFIGFLIASFGFVLWLYLRNIFVVFTGPFSYLVLETFILSYLGVPYFRLVTSFNPSALSSTVITTERLLVGPLLLFILISALLCFRYGFNSINQRKGKFLN